MIELLGSAYEIHTAFYGQDYHDYCICLDISWFVATYFE